MKNISFKIKNKKIEIYAKQCNPLEKIFGLMFKSRKNAKALLFEFNKPVRLRIHSFFVFFPFVAVWLDNKDKIIKIKKIKPFVFSEYPGKSFSKLLEIPLNGTYLKKVKLLVGD